MKFFPLAVVIFLLTPGIFGAKASPGSLLGHGVKAFKRLVPPKQMIPPVPDAATRDRITKIREGGLRRAEKGLSALPAEKRATPMEVLNAHYYLLSKLGKTQSLILACPECVSDPVLPDEALRAAHLILEEDRFLVASAAGRPHDGALASFRRTANGPKRLTHVSQRRDAAIRGDVHAALAEAAAPLRKTGMSEETFREEVVEGLQALAKEPKPRSRFGFDEIAYDATTHKLAFTMRVGSQTKVKVAELDVTRYVDRLVGLAFGGGGFYLLQPSPGPSEAETTGGGAKAPSADELVAAKARQALAIAGADSEGCTGRNCQVFLADPYTNEELRDAIWGEAILEILAARP